MADPPQQERPGWRDPVLYVGVLVLVLFALFVRYMVDHAAGANETEWARDNGIFTGVEAIAFGAAGALFGTRIQATRADRADKRAEEATKKAGENADAANRGRALAASLRADRVAGRAGGDRLRGGTPVEDPVTARHAALADELFPPPSPPPPG